MRKGRVRKALRWTHTLWGGLFNPIIPLGNPKLARQLIKTFRVDCLYCISPSQEGDAILQDFKHLLWPTYRKGLFVEGFRGLRAQFLDIYHPVRQLYEDKIKDREHPSWTASIFVWGESDPLADVFLATFGAYPPKGETGEDHGLLFRNLAAKEIRIEPNAALLPASFKEFTPSVLTSFKLRPIDYI